MLSTNAFNYVNVLDKAADASWKRETVLANNIANVNTPGYKRKDLDFESTLKEELGRCKHTSLDYKIDHANLNHLNLSVMITRKLTRLQFFWMMFIRIVWMEAMWILTLKKLSMLLNSFGMRGLRQESTMSLVA